MNTTPASARRIGCRIFTVGVMLFCGACLGISAAAKADSFSAAGAYYVDGRGFTTGSLMMSARHSATGLSLWGFSDVHGDHDSDSLELTRWFTEYRLSHAWPEVVFDVPGLSFQLEQNVITGDGNDVLRAGFTYKHDLPLPWSASGGQGWLQWRLFPYETDNNGAQASLIFSLPISERVALKGFADYNIIDGSDNRWVFEPELSVRLSDRFFGLVEYRYNEFEIVNPGLRGRSLAVGFRYFFNN